MTKTTWTKEMLEKKLANGQIKSVNTNLFGDIEPVSKELKDVSIEMLKLYDELMDIVKEKNAIFIPFHVPSLKNSKQILQMYTGKSACCNAPYKKLGAKNYLCTKCNNKCQLGRRPIITKSKSVQKFFDTASPVMLEYRNEFRNLIKNLPKPLHIGFYFIRSSHHGFDLDNTMTTMLDLMRDVEYIFDDNSKEIYAYPLGEHVDKKNQGVIITPMEKRPTFYFITNKLPLI